MANDCIPYYEEGERLTLHAAGTIIGKRFVKISGNRTAGPGLASTGADGLYQCVQAAAGDQAIGVAEYDVASGDIVPVIMTNSNRVVPVTAGAAIVAGARVEVDASGRAITLASGKAVGTCMTAASGSGVDAEIRLDV